MKYYYDLHMHTALSPCGDNDMTPNNIINMALLKGLDIIAVTDHNATENIRPILEFGKRRQVVVVPGMEIESAEEVHVLSLFPDLESAIAAGEAVRERMMPVKNKEEIFGEQLILDGEDQETGRIETLLITATTLMIDEVFSLVEEHGGIAIPAHVDRDSHSVISNLGSIPEELNVKLIEFSRNCDIEAFVGQHPELAEYPYLCDSDAHYLWDMAERDHYIETEQPITDAKDLVDYLKSISA